MPASSKKTIVLTLLTALFFVAGLLRYTVGDSPALQLSVAIVTSLSALLWVVFDAEERTYKPPKTLRLFICIVALIGVPTYLLRSRGIRGLVDIAGMIAFAVMLVFVDAAGTLIVQNGYFFATSR